MSALESGPVRIPRPPYRHTRSASSFLPVVDETSAGGLVVDVIDGEVVTAVIARRNRGGRLEWCLPKGHIERGETLSETAVREVFEETGIRGRAIVHLATIDYWVAAADRRVHKLVHHFLLEALGGELEATTASGTWILRVQLPVGGE